MSGVRWAAMVAGLLPCAGCVYTPVFSPPDPSSLFDSNPPSRVEVGRSTRADIVAMVGKPEADFFTVDDRACGYLFSRPTGTLTGLFWGACAPHLGQQTLSDDTTVYLAFDRRGILARVDKHRVGWGSSDDRTVDWCRFANSVPEFEGPPIATNGAGPRAK